MKGLIASVAVLLFGGAAYAVSFVPLDTVPEKKSYPYSPWRTAQYSCGRVGGTNSAPVCGGLCDGGGLCDIAITSGGRAVCMCQ